MAYLTFIAAVSGDQIEAIRKDAAFVLTPTMIKGVSHALSDWIQVQPLGPILNSVIDGGDRLNETFWHPLRPPMVHLPIAVPELTESLTTAWIAASADPTEKDEWLSSEMERLLVVMNHATHTNAAIVTSLDLPGDLDRARRIRLPWMPSTTEHGAPPRRWWRLW